MISRNGSDYIMDKEYMSKRRYKSGDYSRKDTSKKGSLQGRDE
jgi:hypothetical protein